MLELRALQQDFLKLIPRCLHADASHSFLRYAPVIHCRNTSSARYPRDASMYLASASFEHCSGICSHMLQASILTTLVARTRCLQKKLLSSVKQKPLVGNSAVGACHGCDCRCGQRHLASRKFEQIASDSNPTVAAVTRVQKSLTVTALPGAQRHSREPNGHFVFDSMFASSMCSGTVSRYGLSSSFLSLWASTGFRCFFMLRSSSDELTSATFLCFFDLRSVSEELDAFSVFLVLRAYFCWACSWTSSSPLSCCPRYLTFGGVY